MSYSLFIPTLWAGVILQNLDKKHVYAPLANRNYEGMIRSQGDSVKIHTVGDITIRTYTKGSDLTAAEELPIAELYLLIDQGFYFNFGVSDVDAVQMNVEILGIATQRAGYGLAQNVDEDLATLLNNNVPAANDLGTLTVGTGVGDDDLYEAIVDMATAMDELNVEEEGRFVVLPPFARGLIRKDSRFSGNGTAENVSLAVTGRGAPVSSLAGFSIYISNNNPTSGSGTYAIAGVMDSFTFAEQILMLEAYRPEKRFEDAIKGLHVFGYKVLYPQKLARALLIEA